MNKPTTIATQTNIGIPTFSYSERTLTSEELLTRRDIQALVATSDARTVDPFAVFACALEAVSGMSTSGPSCVGNPPGIGSQRFSSERDAGAG